MSATATTGTARIFATDIKEGDVIAIAMREDRFAVLLETVTGVSGNTEGNRRMEIKTEYQIGSTTGISHYEMNRYSMVTVVR